MKIIYFLLLISAAQRALANESPNEEPGGMCYDICKTTCDNFYRNEGYAVKKIEGAIAECMEGCMEKKCD